MTTATTIEQDQLLLLLTFLSPAFPTGAFAYSHGLEQAIASGAVSDSESLTGWLSALLIRGSAWNDAVLLRAVGREELASLNSLALSLSASRERHLETTALGGSFAASAAVFGDLALPEGEIAYPIAVGAAASAAGISCEALIPAYLHAFAASLVSVAVRLVPLGQTSGLSVLARLMPVISEVTQRALGSTLDDLGSATFLSDIAAMRHEFQEPRIFRT